MTLFTDILFAQATAKPVGPNMIQIIGYTAILMGMFWVMLIRPQQRRDKERKAMVSSLKKGARVMFCGGMMGTISHKREDEGIYVVKIADGVKIEVHEQAIMDVVDKGKTAGDVATNLNK